MAEMRCSRCDRVRGPDEFTGLGELVGSVSKQPPLAGSLLGDPGPWAEIDGLDVCPQCQTPREREDVARRTVALIEARISRLQDEHAEPTQGESPLIAFAMLARERLAALARQAEEAHVPPREDRPPGTELRVAVTGAFLTGHPVRVRIRDYERLRITVGKELPAGRGWSVERLEGRRGGTYESGGGFATMLPLVLARRSGGDMLERAQAALGRRRDEHDDWLIAETRGWVLSASSLRIDVYDLGMAVMNGTLDVQLPTDASLPTAARTLNRLVRLKPGPDTRVASPIVETFQELANETAHEFAAAVRRRMPEAVQEAWLSPFLRAMSDVGDDEGGGGDWGRLLWLHPIHVLRLDRGSEDETAVAVDQLAPLFHRSIGIPDGRFVPGIGWSAIVAAADADVDTDIPLELTELHWAYYALYMEIDRGLLALLDDDRWYEPDSLEELELDADRVFGHYMRVMEARARLDSELASRGGDELAIWDAIADVQRFDALVDAVERKVEALYRVAERRVQQAAARRARRTGRILGGLTALTVVTVAVAVATYFMGGRTDDAGHVVLRMGIAAAGFALAAWIGWLAHRERALRRARVRYMRTMRALPARKRSRPADRSPRPGTRA